MNETVLVGLLSRTGTLIGSLGGIVASNRLTAFRLEQLEEKVNKHNLVIERTCRLEEQMTGVQQELHAMQCRMEGRKQTRSIV